MDDLVIDTNVLVHAQNPNEERHASAKEFLTLLLDHTATLCVDEGFSPKSEKNRSTIGGEYLDKLIPGSVGFAVIVRLVQELRVKQVKRRPRRSDCKKIDQMIRNKRDRTFVGVACNSTERVLVSHDFVDFQARKRKAIKKALSVSIIEACDCELD